LLQKEGKIIGKRVKENKGESRMSMPLCDGLPIDAILSSGRNRKGGRINERKTFKKLLSSLT
jgi:hypothetical protein